MRPSSARPVSSGPTHARPASARGAPDKTRTAPDKAGGKRLLIHLGECQYPVLRKVAKLRRMAVVTGTDPVHDRAWDLCWLDHAVGMEMTRGLQQWQRVNHFPGMSCLHRKNELGLTLKRMR